MLIQNDFINEIRKNIDVKKKIWNNIDGTNCYAYALGIDVSEYKLKEDIFSPGVISNSKVNLTRHEYFSYDLLMDNLFSDFKALGIEYRLVEPLDEILEDEWKIALFVSEIGNNLLDDFHFMRQFSDGIWHHKNGYYGLVSEYDNKGKIITNPMDCSLRQRSYDKCFCLKLK